MDEENRQPRQGVSRSFIFSIFIVAGIIALVAYFIFSNMNTSQSISIDTFVKHLKLGNVNDVQLVQAETRITINGH